MKTGVMSVVDVPMGLHPAAAAPVDIPSMAHLSALEPPISKGQGAVPVKDMMELGSSPTSSNSAYTAAALEAFAERECPGEEVTSHAKHLPPLGSVIGHRGNGANLGVCEQDGEQDGRFAGDVRENTLLSFFAAALGGAKFIEFDVQVTRDHVPVIWHDDVICYRETQDETNGEAGDEIRKFAIGDLTLEEFQRISARATEANGTKGDLTLMRSFSESGDAPLKPWVCKHEDALPTLEQVLRKTPNQLGLNVELKFAREDVPRAELEAKIRAVIECIFRHGDRQRRIYLSSFDPDACIACAQMQASYPVMLLTDAGGIEYKDARRNSASAAIDVAIRHKMAGVVIYSDHASEQDLRVAVESGLDVFTFGNKNNDKSYSKRQMKEMGVRSVIVDDVSGVWQAVSK